MKFCRYAAILLVVLFLLTTTSTAFASPWTLPQDELVLTISQDLQSADQEFLPNGTNQAFPLNGTYRSQTTRLGARYGFTDRFEGAADLNFSLVSYRADALILDDFPDGITSSEATAEIRDFNSAQFGAGDFNFHARYKLLDRAVLITSETTLKLPTGYEAPTGTFFTNENGEQTIGGQATLGDAQTDLTQRILFGTYIPPTRTFLRLDTGFRLRFGSPGHQVVANFRAGQFIGENLVITAGAGWTQSITEGEIIGQTFTARDPSLAAADYTGDNIEVLDLRLDRDALNLEAGALLRIGDIEFVANYGHTLYGTNTAAIHAISLGAIFSFAGITER